MCDFNLIFVQLTVLILFLSLLLEGDDDKTHKDVHHEKSDDNDVDDEEDGDLHTVVVDGADVLSVRVNGFVQQPGEQKDRVSTANPTQPDPTAFPGASLFSTPPWALTVRHLTGALPKAPGCSKPRGTLLSMRPSQPST